MFGLKKIMAARVFYSVSTVLYTTSRILPRRLHIAPSYSPHYVPPGTSNQEFGYMGFTWGLNSVRYGTVPDVTVHYKGHNESII